jgi:predicted peptidase
MRKLLLSLITLIAGPGQLLAQQRETGFLNRSVTIAGTSYRYQVYVPANYDSSVAWPVILSLHGFGERGSDGLAQTLIGLAAAIRRSNDKYPAIVVFPQAPPTPEIPVSIWQSADTIALAALDQTLQEFNADTSRVYLTGLSQGGHGTWYVASHHPERFAALVVVCGWVAETGGRPGVSAPTAADPYAALAQRIKQLPVWIFHGEADTVIPVEEARRMYSALQAVGAKVRYTEFAGGNHNAWDPAYLSPDLPGWLFAQRRILR